jgi:predicted DNA-binding transcriptional regulator YafY
LEEETVEGEAVRVRLRFDAEEEALQFALSFGAQVVAIEPPELSAKVVAAARAIVERYTQLTSLPDAPIIAK